MVTKVTAFSSSNVKRASLARDGRSIIENLWLSRLALREQMRVMTGAGDTRMKPACVSAFRNAFRSLRFLEEYVAVQLLPAGAWVEPTSTRVFSGGFPATVKAPQVKSIGFKSGDVLVSYGMAYGSAAIAHVGEDAGMFSHMALVYVGTDGRAVTIEAHPEFGVKVAPIEKYLTDGKGRSALYRHKDAALAALAAKRMYDVAFPPDLAGRPIPYDFSMDLDEHSKLFCTEIIRYAFEMASREMNRGLAMPPYPTHIAMKNSYILDAFGITARDVFAPSDIDVDPQFTLLAEWRDVARVRLMHHQQAALQSQFKWLDSLSYEYRSSLETVLASGALHSARHMPLFDGFVDDLVPPDLSRETLEAVVQVYLVSDDIHDDLIVRDRAQEQKRGTLLTASEITAAVEAGREADLAAYLKYQLWLKYDRYSGDPAPPSNQWHWMLRADEEVAP